MGPVRAGNSAEKKPDGEKPSGVIKERIFKGASL